MKRILTFLIFAVCCFIPETQATIRYVRPASYGNGSGTSWTNASNDLQLMINNSQAGDSVFVAEGTYLPIRKANALNTITLNNRDNAFVLKADIKIFGGFPNNDTATWTDRNWNDYPSVLSGDIGVPNDSTDNCYHVVISAGEVGTACLDGFRITKGNANTHFSIEVNGYWALTSAGGGIYIENSSPTLVNLIIDNNEAFLGGGVFNYRNAILPLMLTNVIIKKNNTIYDNFYSINGIGGSGIFNASISVLSNVLIVENFSHTRGGGIVNAGTLTLTNVTVSQNVAYETGGGIHNGFPWLTSANIIMHNSIIWGNMTMSDDRFYDNTTNYGDFMSHVYCLVGGRPIGNGIILNSDPLFVNTASGNYRLNCNSSAIDMGNNASVQNIATDLDGNSRIYNGIVDLGAYELRQDSILFSPLSFVYSGLEQVPKVTTLSGFIPNILYKEKNASDNAYIPNKPVNAGIYTVKASLIHIGICVTDTTDFVILPKDITVKANGGSSIYGDNPPANPKFTAAGLVNGETESVLTNLYNDFSINNTTPAGTYMLSVIGTLTNTNYNITTYDTGTWIVEKRPLTIKAISDTIYYGQTPVLRYEIVSGSLVNGDVLSGALYVDNYEVGTHTIGQGTLTAGDNYVITFIDGTLLVWSIQDVFVDNKLSGRHKNYFQFDSDCGMNEVSVYVTCYQCVKILIDGVEQNPSTVSLPNYGDNNILITVIAQNGDAQTHTLTINKPIPFDQIVKMHCNNTITVNNNPLHNGGFRFTSYKWFCNDKQFSENQSWSASKEWWSPSDLFHVELTATGYSGILRTCKSRISLKDMELQFYPNPISIWQTLYIKGDLDDDCLKDAVIAIYDMLGRVIETFPLTSLQIPIDGKYFPGVYLVILKGKDGYKKEAGIIVYE